MTDELKKKIANRDTELQRAYDLATMEYAKWQGIKLGAEQKMKEMRKLINKCVQAAKEQDCEDVL